MQVTLEGIFRDRGAMRTDILDRMELSNKMVMLILMIFASSGLYGFSMGFHHSLAQAFSSAVKVPLLFFSTLLICFSTLHFIGLFLGSRVDFRQSLTVLLWGICVSSVLLGAFAPVAFFFLISGSSYAFILLMHVSIFIVCGAGGLVFIRNNMKALSGEGRASDSPLLMIWMCLYMFVGTQMAYVLSPFVGKEKNFILLYTGKGNFYGHVLETIGEFMR